MFTTLLAIALGTVVGAGLGWLFSHQNPGQNVLHWVGAGAGIGAVAFWLLQALLKFVLRSLCWIGLGGLVGAGLSFAVLKAWPACPVPALPQWLALAFAVGFLLRTWAKED